MTVSIDTMRALPLFATLSEHELVGLCDELIEQAIAPGEVLMKEGGRTEKVFLVIEGQLEVVKSMGPDEERLLKLVGTGAMLGEMSLFNDRRTHTATVRARTHGCVMVLPFAQFARLIQEHSEIAYNLLRTLSLRAQESDELAVMDLREKNRQLTIAYEELKAAQAALIEKEKLEHELELAAQMQCSVLPQRLPVHPNLDFGALMIPARMVGGDFYDFIPLSNRRMGLVVGDVCDKGMPAALYMGMVYSALRIASAQHASPGAALRAVNRHLYGISQSSGMYVTLLYGVLDLQSGVFSYARAGHPYPLLLDRDNQALPVPTGRGQPLGMFKNVILDEQTINIPPGGTLLIYSDGLSETIEARAERIELAALCAQLMAGVPPGAQELCERLWQAAGEGDGSGDSAISDDFTVITARHRED